MQPNFSNPPARESGEEQLGPVSNGNSPGSLACSSDSGIRIDSSSYRTVGGWTSRTDNGDFGMWPCFGGVIHDQRRTVYPTR